MIVALATLFIDYTRWRSNAIPPEVFVRPHEIAFSYDSARKNPWKITGQFEFSVSNRSSTNLFLATCVFVGDGIHFGHGGFGEATYPCEGPEVSALESEGASIEAGQTKFFKVEIVEEMSDYEYPHVAANRDFYLKLGEHLNDANETPCIVEFDDRGWAQSCPAIDSGSHLYSLLLQFGNGSSVRKEIVASETIWPWGRLPKDR